MKTGCAIVGAVVAILVLSGIAFFLLIWNAAGPAAAVGDAFVEQIADGNIPAAYALTAGLFQEDYTEEQLTAYVESIGLNNASPDSTSWTSRGFDNNVAYVEGKVTTRSGSSIPLRLEMIKEKEGWRITRLSEPTDDDASAADSTSYSAAADNQPILAVPSPRDLHSLVEVSLLSLNRCFKDGNFEPFHSAASKQMQAANTVEDFAEAFSAFVEQEISYDIIAGLTPTFDAGKEAPRILNNRYLETSGHYLIDDAQLLFKLRYLLEDGEWKTTYIDVNIQPVSVDPAPEAPDPAPAPAPTQ